MPELNTVTDPYLPEPKGASSASVDQVYKADGAGSGDWSDTIHNVHGGMVIQNSTTATAVTAAADATLNTDSDYSKVIAGWSSAELHNISFNSDELVVSRAGAYYLSFWATIKIPLNNNFIAIKYAINDTTPYSTRKVKTQSTTINDYVNLSASGIIVGLNASDTVSVYLAGTSTDNLVVEEAGLTLLYLHE